MSYVCCQIEHIFWERNNVTDWMVFMLLITSSIIRMDLDAALHPLHDFILSNTLDPISIRTF